MTNLHSVQKMCAQLSKKNEGILLPCMLKKQKLLTFGWMRSNEQLSLIKLESQTATSIRIICNYANILWIGTNKWFYPFIQVQKENLS
jgi:hypothetical protein